jgi:FkbM family methyltransferase
MDRAFCVRLGSSDLQLHQTIRFRGEYGPALENPFRGPIRQVVDLGSNAGYTIRLWQELFPNARIIGVEPDRGNLRLCRLNAQMKDGTVNLIQACVDGKSGTVWLDTSGSEHQFKIGSDVSARGVHVEALTVPQILDRAKADKDIDLLKCDVQGAEQAIFADCNSWINRVRNMIVEVHPPYTPEDLLADLHRNSWEWSRHIVHRTDDLPVLFFWGRPEIPEN